MADAFAALCLGGSQPAVDEDEQIGYPDDVRKIKGPFLHISEF